jgi:hypothetical protein
MSTPPIDPAAFVISSAEIAEFSLCIAAASFALGIFNSYQNLKKDRVRLSVVPKLVFKANGLVVTTDSQFQPGAKVAVEVINLSVFPLVITGIGFQLRKGFRAALTAPFGVLEGGQLPYKLGPREKLMLFTDHPLPSDALKAYAQTACGHSSTGSSKAFRFFMAQK